MKNKTSKILTALMPLLIIMSVCTAQVASQNMAAPDLTGWKEEKVSPEQLSKWTLLGQGTAGVTMADQVSLAEADVTKGVMLVSPASYGKNVVLRYKVLALTDASVFVNILSASDRGSDRLNIPDGYDGGMDLWTQKSANYFFAFKNAPHAGTPFIKKNADPAKESVAPEPDKMVAGVYYDIEAGKNGTKLWLAIDGKKILEMEDAHAPLNAGHLAFRLRGLPGFKAACLIRDVRIYTN